MIVIIMQHTNNLRQLRNDVHGQRQIATRPRTRANHHIYIYISIYVYAYIYIYIN